MINLRKFLYNIYYKYINIYLLYYLQYINNLIIFIYFIRSIVGYIDSIIETRTYTNKRTGSDFQIMKFILNNNNGIKIQCNVFDDKITQFSNHIKLDDVNINIDILLHYI